MENCGTEMKGRIGENLIVTLGGQLEFQEILLDDRDILAFRDVFAEFFGGLMIWLNRNHLLAAARKRGSNYSGAGADIEHEVTLLNIAVANQKAREFRPAQEMLT